MKALSTAAISWLVLLTPNYLLAQDYTPQQHQVPEKTQEFSPYVDQHFPKRVYFGDTHHHSSFSFDSGMFGNTLGPEDSFRFARGEEVTAANGVKAKLI
jgi:hypothetical protein